MRFLIEQSSYSLIYNNILSVGRALTSYGQEVVMWNPNEKTVIDALEEVSPNVFIHFTELKENAQFVAKSKSIFLISSDTFDGVMCDPIVYFKTNPSVYFSFHTLGFLPYPEFEKLEPMYSYMSPNNNNVFRLFSPTGQPGAKYCGWLAPEMHALMLSSVKIVVTSSEAAAINAALCNDEVYIGKEKYVFDREDLIKNRSSLSFSQTLLRQVLKDEELAKFEESLNAKDIL